jgi:hypothetical protein
VEEEEEFNKVSVVPANVPVKLEELNEICAYRPWAESNVQESASSNFFIDISF